MHSTASLRCNDSGRKSEADREARIASLLEQGASQASAGDLDAALLTYQSVLDRDSDNETALTEISTVRQRIRDRDAQRAEQDRIRREQEAARRTITGTITDSRSGSAFGRCERFGRGRIRFRPPPTHRVVTPSQRPIRMQRCGSPMRVM